MADGLAGVSAITGGPFTPVMARAVGYCDAEMRRLLRSGAWVVLASAARRTSRRSPEPASPASPEWLNPVLPDDLDSLAFELRYRNQWISVTVDHRQLVLRASPGAAPPVSVTVRNATYPLAAGGTVSVPLT